jgi:hypothetical protein
MDYKNKTTCNFLHINPAHWTICLVDKTKPSVAQDLIFLITFRRRNSSHDCKSFRCPQSLDLRILHKQLRRG